MVLDEGRKAANFHGRWRQRRTETSKHRVKSPGNTGGAFRSLRSRIAFTSLHPLVYLGALLGLIGALALPWVRVKVSLVLTFNLDFKLLENAWLTGITIGVLVLTLLLVHWRRAGAWAALIGGVACLGIIGTYAYAMAAKAFHILGLLKNIPLIGGPLSEFARNITSVAPAPGFLLFAAGSLLILTGGILLVGRGRRWGSGVPSQPNLS